VGKKQPEDVPETKTEPAQAFEYKEHKTLSSLRLMALSNQGP